jgi:hypothetical protein
LEYIKKQLKYGLNFHWNLTGMTEGKSLPGVGIKTRMGAKIENQEKDQGQYRM